MAGGVPEYAEFEPAPALREFVHCIWTFSAPKEETPQPIVPDGRAELIIHLGMPYAEAGEDGVPPRPQSWALFAGQLTRPLVLEARGDVAVVGIRFRPDGARAFLHGPADSATDRRIALDDLCPADAAVLAGRLSSGDGLYAAADCVQAFVAGRVQDAEADPMVRGMVEDVLAGGEGDYSGGVSGRQVQRRFKAEVGISLKMFRSIRRFRRVFDALQDPEDAGWAQRALAAGYFDQPQMARDFRRFLGCTARQWLDQQDGLSRKLGEAPG